MPAVGEVVDGKYRIERLVGEGAMGRVYRAQHVLLGHSVAIKILRASVDTEEVRSRFFREAKATMALRSDHIVRVFDLGILPPKTPYMVLEYLEGIDLRSLLDTSGALPVEEAVDYTLQACEALAEAHLNGIVHRDLKPHNLFRTRRTNGSACIKLLDFGVSKFEAPGHHHPPGLPPAQVRPAPPASRPPGQFRPPRGAAAGPAVWSPGAALSLPRGGGLPLGGGGLPARGAPIRVAPPRPLSQRCPSVPRALEAVILRCLEKSRDLRIPNVAEVARALEPFASPEGRVNAERVVQAYGSRLQRAPLVDSEKAMLVPSSRRADDPTSEETALAPLAASVPVTIEEATHIASLEPTAPSGRRFRRAIGVFGVAVAALIAGAVFVTRRADSSSPPVALTTVAAPSVVMPASVDSGEVEVPPAPALEASAGSSRPSSKPPPRVRSVRGTMPVSTTGAVPKKTHQVDRNGVPILD